MLKLKTNNKPKNRITLYGSKLLSLGITKKCIMIRSRILNIKIQLNFKGEEC